MGTKGGAPLTLLNAAGSIGLFLFGLHLLSEALEAWAKPLTDAFRTIQHPVLAFAAGLLATSLLQSSSAVTVMTVGLVSAGALPLASSVPLIMGANVGTTLTVQLVSLPLEPLALPAVGAGTLLYLFIKPLKRYGQVLLGLGILFLGFTLLTSHTGPLVQQPWVSQSIQRVQHSPLLSLTAGVILTTLMDSSSAFIALLQSLVQQQILSVYAAVPMLLGANIGTTTATVIASLAGTRKGQQAAAVHLIFNLTSSLLALPALGALSLWLSPVDADPVRLLANLHTGFNLASTALWFPFQGLLLAMSRWARPGPRSDRS